MAKLRITDAALLSTVKGNEKIPTGEVGNYAVSIDQVAAYTKEKLNLEDSTSVDNKVLDVQTDIDLHKNDLLNPHQVTKTQVGLGNVDNTSDLDKPLSNADITALSLKADKTYVDSQDQLKADKTTVEGLLLLKADKSYVDSQDQLKADKTTVEASLLLKADKVDLTASKVSSDGGQTQQEINDFGGAKWHSKLGGYDLGATVKLENGDIVKSTVANNSTNPNINMTGWFVPYMRGSQNLVELTDKATSRSNLDVYSKGEALAKDNNLSELSDKAIARTNLDVYSKTETNTAINNAKTILNNTLTSTATDQALTAAQGKVLKDLADTKLTTTSAFGVGQPWTNLTGSRTLGTTYTNSTGKAIYVSVRVGMTAGAGMTATVSGLQVCEGFAQNSATRAWAGFIVPNGSTYSVSASSLNTWSEMR